MTAHVTVCTVVACPPAVLWAVLEPIERHVEWMADALRITFVSDTRRGVGTEFDCLTRIGPFRTVDRMRVTEWDPGRAMGIEHRGAVTGTGRFTLVPEPGGTRFCWDEHLRFPWWLGGPVGAWLARPVLRAVWRRNLERLRAIAEAPAP